jgi:hypothetical protein
VPGRSCVACAGCCALAARCASDFATTIDRKHHPSKPVTEAATGYCARLVKSTSLEPASQLARQYYCSCSLKSRSLDCPLGRRSGARMALGSYTSSTSICIKGIWTGSGQFQVRAGHLLVQAHGSWAAHFGVPQELPNLLQPLMASIRLHIIFVHGGSRTLDLYG